MSQEVVYKKSILELGQWEDGEIYVDEGFESIPVERPSKQIQVSDAWEKRNIDLFLLQEGNFIIPKITLKQEPLPIYIDELIIIPDFPIAFAPHGIKMGEFQLSMLLPIDEHYYFTRNLPNFQKELLGEDTFLIVAKSPIVFFTLFSEKECEALAYGMFIQEVLEEIQEENPIFIFDDNGNLNLEKTKANLGRRYMATPFGQEDMKQTELWLNKAKLDLEKNVLEKFS